MEYAVFASNGLGVPGAGKAADWADLGGLIGTTGNVNNAMAYGGRLGFWLPAWASTSGPRRWSVCLTAWDRGGYSIWQPYFNYHYGNWDFRFEYGNSYENAKTVISDNIRREGMYTRSPTGIMRRSTSISRGSNMSSGSATPSSTASISRSST